MSGSSFGFNPLRWNCEQRGCFNDHHRPRIEVFADCLPRKISFTDIDALVELDNRFLILEFKASREIKYGQLLAFERLTSLSSSIIVVQVCASGEAKDMNVESFRVISKGKCGPWQAATIEDLRERVQRWADHRKAAR